MLLYFRALVRSKKINALKILKTVPDTMCLYVLAIVVALVIEVNVDIFLPLSCTHFQACCSIQSCTYMLVHTCV